MKTFNMLTLTLLCACVLTSGCGAERPSEVVFAKDEPLTRKEASKLRKEFTYPKQITALQLANPTNDARIYFEKGDHRLVSVMAMFLKIPTSVPHSDSVERDFRQPGRTKTIVGTSDYIKDPAGENLLPLAMDYAKKYNDHMLFLLRQSGKMFP